MKIYRAGLAALALMLVACNGGGGSDEDDGQVINRRINGNSTVFELELSDVVPHGTHVWWIQVPVRVFNNCQIGDTWSDSNPDGCG